MALYLDGFTHHVVDTGEVEIGYSVGPDNGPAMLLLHGNSCRRDSFLNVAGLLSESYKVFAVDTRGMGSRVTLQGSTRLRIWYEMLCLFSGMSLENLPSFGGIRWVVESLPPLSQRILSWAWR